MISWTKGQEDEIFDTYVQFWPNANKSPKYWAEYMEVIGRFPPQLAMAAMKDYLRESKASFAPTPEQLRERLVRLKAGLDAYMKRKTRQENHDDDMSPQEFAEDPWWSSRIDDTPLGKWYARAREGLRRGKMPQIGRGLTVPRTRNPEEARTRLRLYGHLEREPGEEG